MSVPELSIQIKNTPGQLMQITAILAEANVNIKAITASSAGKLGWVRMIVDNEKNAQEALEDCGYDVDVGEAIAIILHDEPGALDTPLRILADAKINVDYIYTSAPIADEYPIVIFGVQSPSAAERLLKKHHVKVAAV